ncbi:hypothetical protein N9L68_08280 [bacterium]|nr:hypothetical protein [bacterium]
MATGGLPAQGEQASTRRFVSECSGCVASRASAAEIVLCSDGECLAACGGR